MSVKARAKLMGRAALATSIGSLLLVANPTSAHAAPSFTVNGSSVTGSLNYIYSSMTGGNSYTFNFAGSDWKTLKVKLYGAGGGHANGAAGGYVVFYASGKRIPGCSRVTVVATSATCTWRPSVRNALIISASLFPSNGALTSNSSISVSVGARTNTR